jgi:hypothetical protein
MGTRLTLGLLVAIGVAIAGCSSILGIGDLPGPVDGGTDGTVDGPSPEGSSSADVTGDAPGDAGSDALGPDGQAADGPATSDGHTEGASPESGADGGIIENPTTCAEALAARTYLGCDFWPTVTANNVWSIFDFAAVVANEQSIPVDVSITGPNGFTATQVVPASSLTPFYLPWVPVLKGGDSDNCGVSVPFPGSVLAKGAAYHLSSTYPVAVYQFNALEYQGQGGPSGKSWASCPGNTVCTQATTSVGCYSFTNDASLLLPSHTWTGNYRVATAPGWPVADMAALFAVTAAHDATHVTIHVSPTGEIAGTPVAYPPADAGPDAAPLYDAGPLLEAGSLDGGPFPFIGPNGTLTIVLNQGDVVEVSGTPATDLGGTLVQADQPVQVIAGMPCGEVPTTAVACDHLEQTVLPAETLGKDYLVNVPTGPRGNAPGHVVRFFGNADGTTLTYDPAMPAGCPATLSAGQVGDCGLVTTDFEVKGTHEFEVETLMAGASILDPTSQAPNQLGDPSQSFVVPVEQFRADYLFATPVDYAVSFVDVVAPAGVQLTLDAASIAPTFTAIGTSGYGVARVQLGATTGGRHVLHASQPVTIQVMGYAPYTSYQYPGGLDLALIAAPPAH